MVKTHVKAVTIQIHGWQEILTMGLLAGSWKVNMLPLVVVNATWIKNQVQGFNALGIWMANALPVMTMYMEASLRWKVKQIAVGATVLRNGRQIDLITV
ncbi:MAG: hypothetical protein IPH94_00275 [Saprospiraceae bacterium]|nr:hypothetical protein [Saprospiraceae bacterium]